MIITNCLIIQSLFYIFQSFSNCLGNKYVLKLGGWDLVWKLAGTHDLHMGGILLSWMAVSWKLVEASKHCWVQKLSDMQQGTSAWQKQEIASKVTGTLLRTAVVNWTAVVSWSCCTSKGSGNFQKSQIGVQEFPFPLPH